MNPPALAQLARKRSARAVTGTVDRAGPTRVTLAWTPGICQSVHSGPTELELVAGLATAADATWTCAGRFGANWLETISAAGCSEVVLTAHLGNDIPAKHRVLELADFLTFRLSGSHPLIRVRFLPKVGARGSASSHA